MSDHITSFRKHVNATARTLFIAPANVDQAFLICRQILRSDPLIRMKLLRRLVTRFLTHASGYDYFKTQFYQMLKTYPQ
jgi:hypothetical protein